MSHLIATRQPDLIREPRDSGGSRSPDAAPDVDDHGPLLVPQPASVLVAQLGARMHYAVPRIFAAAGCLDHLCTDIYAAARWRRATDWLPTALRPPALSRLLGRVPEGVAPSQVTAFNWFGWDFARRRAGARLPSEITAVHLWAGRRFCELVLKHGLGDASALYCFNSAGLELMRQARERGMTRMLEQTIAPRDIGARLLAEEHAAFPGWEPPPPTDGLMDELAARERDEWDAASLVLCGSDFVRDGIGACGGPSARCVVVPYGVDAAFVLPERKISDRRLRVLTVGEVGLRKGAPYVAAAAKRCGADIEVRMVGGSSLSARARGEMARHVTLAGSVPRSQILAEYRWADVFLLPSLYEGSATVIYEALAAGLPVVCTPNAGSIVKDGVDGFIVPIRDADAIADRLMRLSDPAVRAEMSANARRNALDGQLSAYRKRLLAALVMAQDLGP